MKVIIASALVCLTKLSSSMFISSLSKASLLVIVLNAVRVQRDRHRHILVTAISVTYMYLVVFFEVKRPTLSST